MRAEWLPAMAHRRMGGRATSCATGVSLASAGVILFGGARAIFARTPFPLLAWRSTTAAARKLATICPRDDEAHQRRDRRGSRRASSQISDGTQPPLCDAGRMGRSSSASFPALGRLGLSCAPGDGSHPGRGPSTTTVDGSWSKKPGGAGWTLAALDGDHLGTKAPGPDVSARERIEHVGGRAGHEDE